MVELTVTVGKALYHAYSVELFENKHVAEDVPVGNWFLSRVTSFDLALVNHLVALHPDLKSVMLNVLLVLGPFFVVSSEL